MNDLKKRETQEMTRLDGLAMQARHFVESIAINTLELGRVLIEAKELVSPGEWGQWVHENGGMSERMAQYIMQTYRRFGDKPYAIGIDKTKLFKMLALPEGTEDDFAEQNDISDMTTRQIEEAVKQAKAEFTAELQAKQEIIDGQLDRIGELNGKIAERNETINNLKTAASDAIRTRNEAQQAQHTAEAERDEAHGMLEGLQNDYDELQSRMLDIESQKARGDAERKIDDGLTPEAFSAAVQAFIGSAGLVPFMSSDFGVMKDDARRAFDRGIRAIEKWTKDARKAFNTVEAVILDAE